MSLEQDINQTADRFTAVTDTYYYPYLFQFNFYSDYLAILT
jgi:hypothetical protein